MTTNGLPSLSDRLDRPQPEVLIQSPHYVEHGWRARRRRESVDPPEALSTVNSPRRRQNTRPRRNCVG